MDLRVRFDRMADAACMYLRDIQRGGVAETIVCDDLPVNLDVDKEGTLVVSSRAIASNFDRAFPLTAQNCRTYAPTVPTWRASGLGSFGFVNDTTSLSEGFARINWAAFRRLHRVWIGIRGTSSAQ